MRREDKPVTIPPSSIVGTSVTVVSGRGVNVGLGEVTQLYPREVVISGLITVSDGDGRVRNVEGRRSVLVVGKMSVIAEVSPGNLDVSVSEGLVKDGADIGKMSDVVDVSPGPFVVSVSVGKRKEKSVVVPASRLVAVSVGKSVMGTSVVILVNEPVITIDEESVGKTGDASVELEISVAVDMVVSLGRSVKEAVGSSKVSDGNSTFEVLDGPSLAE